METPTVKKKIGGTEFTCEVCGKVYKTRRYYKTHVSSHTQAGRLEECIDQPSRSLDVASNYCFCSAEPVTSASLATVAECALARDVGG